MPCISMTWSLDINPTQRLGLGRYRELLRCGRMGLQLAGKSFQTRLKPALKQGEPADIVSTDPAWIKDRITNFVTTRRKGDGRSDIYLFISLPNAFVYSGYHWYGNGAGGSFWGIAHSNRAFERELQDYFKANDIHATSYYRYSDLRRSGGVLPSYAFSAADTVRSPLYAAIDYWFLQKASMHSAKAWLKPSDGLKVPVHARLGIEVIKDFWMNRGIPSGAVQIIDGSGLSLIIKFLPKPLWKPSGFARTRWYNRFYSNLPVMNGIRMKADTSVGYSIPVW